MSDLQRDVERLHARYAQALDSDQLEQWPNFFAQNGRYRIATAENEARGLPIPVLYCEGQPMLRHANIYEPQRYRHLFSAVLLEEETPGSVKSIANFLVVRIMENGETTLFASGRYVDRIALPELRYEER